MNDDFELFDDGRSDYLLVDAEARQGLRTATVIGLYVLLGIVILVTGAHGIMLVLYTSAEYSAGTGLFGYALNAVRISFPTTVEIAAVVAGLGFISSQWRRTQKWVGLGIEFVWIVFAAANMITMFNLERGLALETWMESWISYGLPLSALLAGVLVYGLKRTDPDHKRANEVAAAIEQSKAQEFAAKREVALSPQMRQIEKQRQWMDFVRRLKVSGQYTDEQIRFILQDTPQLLIDENHNGYPDLLEEPEETVPGVNYVPRDRTPFPNGGGAA